VCGDGIVSATPKKAIQSFRLRLHSGLRQSGSAFGVVFYGTADAAPFRKAERFGIL
jgi:hypothetical protein